MLSPSLMPRLLLVLALLCACFGAVAQQPVQYSEAGTRLAIGGKVSIFADESNQLSVDEVQNSTAFKATEGRIPFVGLSSASFWVKVPVHNNSTESNLVLELAQPTYDHVEFFAPDGQGGFNRTELGEVVDFGPRYYKDPNYIFPLEIPTGETRTYYLRLRQGKLAPAA